MPKTIVALRDAGTGRRILPNGARIILANFLIGRDQVSKTVGLGLCHDHAVEWIAGPFLVKGDSGNGRKGQIANLDAHFKLDLPRDFPGRKLDPADFVQILSTMGAMSRLSVSKWEAARGVRPASFPCASQTTTCVSR
jgi:hypothetical protein